MTPDQLEKAYDLWQELKKVRELLALVHQDDSHITIGHPSGRLVLEYDNGHAKALVGALEKTFEAWLAELDVQVVAVDRSADE
jgi:hypothetical protein